jgi:hypothetical protein
MLTHSTIRQAHGGEQSRTTALRVNPEDFEGLSFELEELK